MPNNGNIHVKGKAGPFDSGRFTVGTERIIKQPIFAKHIVEISPQSKKGDRSKVNLFIIMDWNGELYTVGLQAKATLSEVLRESSFKELTKKAWRMFKDGLGNKTVDL